ncbi:MAG: tRNA (guanosine(37)-N1)-methyltransferase TrmD [Candidatus Magasanikbacteria bacterium]
MRFDILTLFPDIIYNYCSDSILWRAQQAGHIKIHAYNFREYSKDKHRKVDDTPYGGGAGMVLLVQPIYDCLKKIKAKSGAKKSKIIILDPAGKKFDQTMAREFSRLDRLVLVCGRYQGFDERVYDLADEKVSVGDFVLSGGELPALTIVEAASRLIPGVLGNQESLQDETGKLSAEAPLYTRPENFLGKKVPEVLLRGDHKKIAEWRKSQAA